MRVGITQCYLPLPAFTLIEAMALDLDNPGRMQSWVDFGGGYIPR